MMIRVNLLPYREQQRAARALRFQIMAGVTVVAGLAAVGMGWFALSLMIDNQNRRNDYIKGEIAQLDKQIAEIETLKAEREDLLSRKNVVEKLQENRGEVVDMFEQITRQTPEGIYLVDLKQDGALLTMIGHAQSSARVSVFMRNLRDAGLFVDDPSSPELVEIKAVSVNNARVNQFTLKVKIKRAEEKAGTSGPNSANKTDKKG